MGNDCFSSSYNLKLYRSVPFLSLFGLELCSAVLCLHGSCHPALTPRAGFPWAFTCCSASLEMEGGELCTAPGMELCSDWVRAALLWTWGPHKCSGSLDSYWMWFDHLHSPGGGLSSNALQSVWSVLPQQMLQPLMFFRLVTSMIS